MTSVRVLSSNLDVMERIESSANLSPRDLRRPSHIKFPLYPHQLSSLERMREIEESIHTGMKLGGETIYSSYGILGERSGTGKTLTMLAHISCITNISRETQKKKTLHPSSSPSFFSLGSSQPPLLSTLIVVPHVLFYQWQSEIEKTSLSCTLLVSQKDIDDPLCMDRLMTTHITLVSNTLLPSLSARLHDESYRWERIVYDEADSIRIPSACIPVECNMTWLITSRYKNITHANQQIHSHVVKQLSPEYIETLSKPLQNFIVSYIEQHPLLTLYKTASEGFFKSILANRHPSRGYFVVKTEDSLLEASLLLPEPIVQTITCKPAHARTMELLRHGHVEDAVLSIHPRTMTMEELLTNADRNTQARLQETTTCGVCYEAAESIVPCITPCCMNLFCGKCIVTWFDLNVKCPLCQASLAPTSLIKLDTAVPQRKVEQTKYDHLITLLREKGDGQYILFARNPQEVYSHVVQNLPAIAHEVEILHGNKTVVSNIMAEFTAKRIRVLCFSGDSLGIDVHSATHILVMDRLRGEEEDYIIGRAQRLGRRNPLHHISFSDWST